MKLKPCVQHPPARAFVQLAQRLSVVVLPSFSVPDPQLEQVHSAAFPSVPLGRNRPAVLCLWRNAQTPDFLNPS